MKGIEKIKMERVDKKMSRNIILIAFGVSGMAALIYEVVCILFTASDGTTKLSHEIELFNQTYIIRNIRKGEYDEYVAH